MQTQIVNFADVEQVVCFITRVFVHFTFVAVFRSRNTVSSIDVFLDPWAMRCSVCGGPKSCSS